MHGPENPANTLGLMEEVCQRENLLEAWRRVKANKGSAGIDGMTVGQLSGYLKEHWPTIREQLLNGTYEPQPVRAAWKSRSRTGEGCASLVSQLRSTDFFSKR